MRRMIKCLDKGYVRFVDNMGSDLSVIRSARVSHNADWRAGAEEKSDIRLIQYLAKNKHWTPFESVTFTFEIKAPIFVFRQWHRHRTWSYNEVSARYTELPDEYYIPRISDIGVQSKSNKQGRNRDSVIDDKLLKLREYEIKQGVLLNKQAYTHYQSLIASGWPRELSRMYLPVNMYSRMFATVNLRNLMAFFLLRSDEHAQYEIRVFSDAMKRIVAPLVPVCMQTFEALNEKLP